MSESDRVHATKGICSHAEFEYSQPFSFSSHDFERLANMSFAGRRRVNKAKKGVQFTVMVVGQCSALFSTLSVYFSLRGYRQFWLWTDDVRQQALRV
jgi:hypothetical protein